MMRLEHDILQNAVDRAVQIDLDCMMLRALGEIDSRFFTVTPPLSKITVMETRIELMFLAVQ